MSLEKNKKTRHILKQRFDQFLIIVHRKESIYHLPVLQMILLQTSVLPSNHESYLISLQQNFSIFQSKLSQILVWRLFLMNLILLQVALTCMLNLQRFSKIKNDWCELVAALLAAGLATAAYKLQLCKNWYLFNHLIIA